MNQIKAKIQNMVERSQKRFGIDFKYLIKGEFYLMINKAVNLIAALGLAWAWANWSTPDIYGSYQYIFSITIIISIFTLPGMGMAIIQAVARQLEGSFLAGFKVKLKWGILSSLSSLIIALYYFWQGNAFLPWCFIVIAVFLPFFNALLVYIKFLVGRKLFKVQAKYDALTQIIAAGAMFLTIFLIKDLFDNSSKTIALLLLIGVYYISRTLLRFFFFTLTKNKFKPNNKEDPKTISYGKHLTFTGLLGTVSEHLDKILLFHYLGALELAIYSFAILIPRQLKTILTHISTLAFPKFSVRPTKEIRKTLLKKIYYLVGLMGLGVIIYIAIAPWIYKIFFPQYTQAIQFSQIYALSMIPLCFSFIGDIFKAKMMTKEIYKIRIIGPIIKIVLSLLLIPIYGIWGAVFSVLFSRSINVFIYLYLFRKMSSN